MVSHLDGFRVFTEAPIPIHEIVGHQVLAKSWLKFGDASDE